MAITAFTLNVANNLYRSGSILARLSSDVNGAFTLLGQAENIKFSATPITSAADTKGRTRQLGYNCEISGALQQTSDTELGAMPDLTSVLLDVVVTATQQTADIAEINLAAADTNGVVVYDALMNIGAELDFGGGPSMLPFSIKWNQGHTTFVNVEAE